MSYRERILTETVFPPGRLCLAFSGGSDSLALLSILPKNRSYAVYIDHGIRGREELEKEIELNRRNAERYSIPLKVLHLQEGEVAHLAREEKIGLEAAARKLRYALLMREDADFILTAHHLDDQAETLIMRLLSSSPFYRLEGIKRQNGRIFRPFLAVAKETINSYIAEEGLEYSHDSTNDDTSYRRNHIRHSILPRLSLDEKRLLLSISLNVQAMNEKMSPIDIESGFTFSFSRSAFISAAPVMREEAIYRINGKLGYSSLFPRNECLAISSAIEKGGAFVCSRFYLRCSGDRVTVFPKEFNILFDGMHDFDYAGLSYRLGDVAADDKTLLINFSLISEPLIFRESRESDEIVLKEGRKKVRDLLKEYHVPYCFVLEDRRSIVAVFARLFGGRDRLSRRLLSKGGTPVSLVEVKSDSIQMG